MAIMRKTLKSTDTVHFLIASKSKQTQNFCLSVQNWTKIGWWLDLLSQNHLKIVVFIIEDYSNNPFSA